MNRENPENPENLENLENRGTPKALVPSSVTSLAAMLQHANDEGSSIGIGRTSSCDFRLSLERLTAPIEHCAGDLVATVAAGASLADVNAVLRQNSQWLPLDPTGTNRTIGAIVATNDSGPRRHRYGTPRDLIIGIEVALADGRLAKAGGRVVKNVAGYDLARVMCGSLGSLAVITSATFKLSPIAAASRTVVVTVPDTDALATFARRIADAPLTPSTIEMNAPPCRLLVRFETTTRAAEEQASAVCALCAQETAVVQSAVVLADHEEECLWRDYEARIWGTEGTLLKIAVLPTDVAHVTGTLHRLSLAQGFEYHAGGRAALGVLFVRLSGKTDHHAPIVEELRREVSSRGGSVVVSGGANPARWGDMGDALPLMRAVKARFDPQGTLNPGAGPGGL